MIKRILLIIIVINLISCKSQNDLEFAGELRGCLKDNEVEILNVATMLFEQKLYEYYGSENSNENYISFLTTMSELSFSPNFPKDFFVNEESLKIIDDFDNEGLSIKIWTPYIEESDTEVEIITDREDNSRLEKQLELDILNPNGEFLNCVLDSEINKNIKDILQRMVEINGISPTLTSGALANSMNPDDFNNELNKVVIAVVYYFDVVNMLNKNSR